MPFVASENLYLNGMFWTADASGSIGGLEYLPGETIYAVGRFDRDYLRLDEVVFKKTNNAIEVPFYVIEESADIVSVIFDPIKPVLESDDFYYLYYSGKTITRLKEAFDIFDSNNLELEDFGQLSANTSDTRWTFQKPTVVWSRNQANEDNSKALFEFIGHKVDIYFEVGPNRGKVSYQINDGPSEIVDCYSENSGEAKLISIDTNVVQTNKVRLTVLGQRNAASSSDIIKLTKCDYHQVLVGETNQEEFLSDLKKSYTVGS